MKKYLITSALVTLFAVSQSQAVVTVSLTGNPTSGPAFFVGSSAASPVVLDGSLIRLGTFVNSENLHTAPSAGGSFVEFASSFREFARTTMGNATNTNTGHVVRQNIPGGDAASGSPDLDSFFVGKTIYIWVYGAAVAGDLVPQGVFATTLSFADQPSAVSTSMTTYINAYGQFTPGTAAQSVTAVQGTAPVTRFNLAIPVPEPAALTMLGLLAASGLMRRRR